MSSAGQWKNPEFAVESFHGKVAGETRSETDLSLGIPVELGGKNSARKDVAKGNVLFAEAELLEARAKVRSKLFLKLHRIRQVLHESETVDEAVGTFSKLISQSFNYQNGNTTSNLARISMKKILSIHSLSLPSVLT